MGSSEVTFLSQIRYAKCHNAIDLLDTFNLFLFSDASSPSFSCILYIIVLVNFIA